MRRKIRMLVGKIRMLGLFSTHCRRSYLLFERASFLTTGASSMLKSFFLPVPGVLARVSGSASANGDKGPTLRSARGFVTECEYFRGLPTLEGAKLSSLSLAVSSSSAKLTDALERVLKKTLL